MKREIETDDVVRLYKSGLTTYEISAQMGLCGTGVVLHRLRNAGVVMRRKGAPEKVSVKELTRMAASGMTHKSIAKALGVTPSCVSNRLRKIRGLEP